MVSEYSDEKSYLTFLYEHAESNVRIMAMESLIFVSSACCKKNPKFKRYKIRKNRWACVCGKTVGVLDTDDWEVYVEFHETSAGVQAIANRWFEKWTGLVGTITVEWD